MDAALRRRRYERDFVSIAAIFAVLMVLTNIIGTKLFLFFPGLLPAGFGPLTGGSFVVLTTGLLTYPLTFLCTDVAAEIWGRKRAQQMVLLGFVSSLLMLLVIQVAVAVPRADRFWSDASGQITNGTTVLTTASAGSSVLQVDDAGMLDLDPALSRTGEALLASLVPQQEPRFMAVRSFQAQGSDGDARPQRWDQRGMIHLQRPLAEALPQGSWLVPALRVIALDRDRQAVQVDRPALLPAQGTLQIAAGVQLSYQQRDDHGWVFPQTLPESLEIPSNGLPAAILTRFDAPRLQQAYVAVFAAPGLLLFASMTAYLLAQFLDVSLFHFWRRRTAGRYLWLRNNASTWVSQLVDSIVVNGIFLPMAFGMGIIDTAMVILAVYLVKLVIAAVDTPLIYLVVWYQKRRLGYAFNEEVPDLLQDHPATAYAEH